LSDIFISKWIFRRPNDLDYINYLINLNLSEYNQSQQYILKKKLIDEMPQLNIGNVILKNEGFLLLKNTPLPLPAFSEGRSIGPLQKNKLLILFNNEKALTLNLNTLK
jgi:hypothetical protein